MKVLMLHNYYKVRGGEDVSFEAEWQMLENAGHSVRAIHLSNDQIESAGLLKIARNSIWSRESYDLIDKALDGDKFDVMHVQNFFPRFSPSVYAAAKKHRVAVVQTLRNFRLLCPGGILHRNGRICEDCLSKTFKYPGAAYGCYRDSKLATLSVVGMIAFHHLRGTWNADVDLYIALTEFVRNKFLEAGFPADKVVVKGNVVFPDPGVGPGSPRGVIFVGRLTPEKGIKTLLSAWSLLPRPGYLRIIGEGPLESMVRDHCLRDSSVQFLGRKSSAETNDLIGRAGILVFPSEWYETFGRVAIEGFSKGTPVIASDLGAMSEIVNNTKAGWLFEVGNSQQLASRLQWCLDNPNEVSAMRLVARMAYVERFTEASNCRELIAAYVLARKRSTKSVRV